MNYILIDGSYYIFYRYHALRIWWSHANPDDKEPYKNPIFLNKYREVFKNSIIELEKKLGIDKCIKLVGKDCKRSDIWRTKIYPEYKSTRIGNENIGIFFKMVYDENLYMNSGVENILYHPKLEADDCLAITSKEILNNNPEANIWIITSDCDYLQLSNERINIFDLKFKSLKTSKICLGDPKKDLFCKIVSGDKSDNIPSVIPKCGIKTAIKLYENEDLFKKKIKNVESAEKQYLFNQKLIDFNFIPNEIKNEFITEFKSILISV